MWPDRVSNPGPLTYESGALPTALCGPARKRERERESRIKLNYCNTIKLAKVLNANCNIFLVLYLELLEFTISLIRLRKNTIISFL